MSQIYRTGSSAHKRDTANGEETSIYTISEIGSAQFEKAYPLMNLIAPQLGLDAWRSVCRSIKLGDASQRLDRDTIIVATNPRGYIQGLCVFSPRQDPIHGRVLDVPVFVVVSAADSAGVTKGLFRYLKAVACNEACQMLRLLTFGAEYWDYLDEQQIITPEHGVMIALEGDCRKPHPMRRTLH